MIVLPLSMLLLPNPIVAGAEEELASGALKYVVPLYVFWPFS